MESKNNNLKDLIVSGSYTAFIKGDDWGCGVNKILLSLDHKIDQVNNLSFVVKEKKLTTDYCDTLYPIIESIIYRTVTNVYLVDYSGQITSEPSNFIMIEMKISPAEGNPLLFSMQTQYNTYNDLYELDIMIADGHEMTSLGQKVKQINIAKKMKDKITSADLFEEALYESCDGVSYKYAAYNPVQASDTLVVWLHGLGVYNDTVHGYCQERAYRLHNAREHPEKESLRAAASSFAFQGQRNNGSLRKVLYRDTD